MVGLIRARWIRPIAAAILALTLVFGMLAAQPQGAAAQTDSIWMGGCSNWYGWCVIPVCSNGWNSLTGTLYLVHYGSNTWRTISSQYVNNSCVNFSYWLDGTYTVQSFVVSGNNPYSTVDIQEWAAGPYT